MSINPAGDNEAEGATTEDQLPESPYNMDDGDLSNSPKVHIEQPIIDLNQPVRCLKNIFCSLLLSLSRSFLMLLLVLSMEH